MSLPTVFFNSLGSGSDGNSFFVESPQGALLIDQGFSRRELLRRMEHAECDPGKLCGALLTHSHSDHAVGARIFCDMFGLPLYASAETVMQLKKNGNLPKIVRSFEPGAEFSAGGFKVKSFALSHDVETVGFKLEYCDTAIAIATDLGCVNENVKRHLRNCQALVIESNYDREMLMNSNRSLRLKRRIFGFQGHLGNNDTFELLSEVLDDNSRLLLLAHVSRECNDYDKLAKTCGEHLVKLNRTNCRFEVLTQENPSEKFVIGGE